MHKFLNSFIGIMFFIVLFSVVLLPDKVRAAVSALVSSPYLYNFNSIDTVVESGSLSLSSSPYWWINSGAYLNINNGRGHTNHGSLSGLDTWRLIYNSSNPVDTDNGYKPQNIFRLITRSEWQNMQQEAYFVIKASNISESPNRNASNGLLLLNRYSDNGQTLYYTGVRVDGSAVIKKKLNGTYYTLAYVKNIYPGVYNRDTSSNLLPINKWIGIRSVVKNQSDGSVVINLYIDKGWLGNWELVATAVDDGKKYGPTISKKGFAGIRTDFMDVSFENFRIRTI